MEEVRLAVAAAVAAARHPAAPKLAGTALTLVGGLAEQLPLLCKQQGQQQQQQQQQQGAAQGVLPQLLSLLLHLVQQRGDEKLQRNAATACYRLVSSRHLAAALAAQHPHWCQALCDCYAAMGGMQQRVQAGGDLSTAQFLLICVCHLAAATSACDGGELLQRLLGQPAASADRVLAAILEAPTAAGGEAWWHHLEQAALHLETIAVAVEAVCGVGSGIGGGGGGGISVSGSNSSSILGQLPHLLESLESLLQRAAALAVAAAASGVASAAAEQPRHPQLLLQAVCRVAAAAIAVAAPSTLALALRLLQPCTAPPYHPCVLTTLAQLVAAPVGAACEKPGREMQAVVVASAVRGAAAAGRDADADWQPALLQLGEACLRHQPSVLAGDDPCLEGILSTAQHSMRSYHRAVCDQVLLFAEALCCIGCRPDDGGSGTPQLWPSAAAAADAAAVQHLRGRLDERGLGAALVLGLLLGASGGMPPYTVAPVAEAAFRTWRAVGTERLVTVQRAARGITGSAENFSALESVRIYMFTHLPLLQV